MLAICIGLFAVVVALAAVVVRMDEAIEKRARGGFKPQRSIVDVAPQKTAPPVVLTGGGLWVGLKGRKYLN